jgi:CBS domain-containing protein
VYEIMSEDLVTVAPNDDVLEAANRMLDTEVPHLSVIDDGVAAGMVSSRDALRALVDLRRGQEA